MINAWEYAYDNYDGGNEDALVDAIVEQIADEVCDACDMNEMYSDNERLYGDLCISIREIVLHNINFNEIRKQAENDRDEYFEREKARKGEY